MDESLPLKAFLALAAIALALSIGAMAVRKGSPEHRLVGRVGLMVFGATGLAGLFWALPRGADYPGFCMVLALYLAAAGRVWLRQGGPQRIDRAISGMALVGSLALAATALSVLLGFRAETMGPDAAPLALVFGLIGIGIGRRNVLDFDRDLDRPARQRRHGAHMIGAAIAIGSALGYLTADRFQIDAWLAAAVPVLILLVPLIILPRNHSA
jgi:uncharacterized membrane protein